MAAKPAFRPGVWRQSAAGVADLRHPGRIAERAAVPRRGPRRPLHAAKQPGRRGRGSHGRGHRLFVTDPRDQPGTDRLTRAPHPSFRLIPSRFPPIGLFDTVATAADMAAAMALAGWTNDRLVAERVARLPREDWVHGRPNASIVMAAFLHVPPGGNRF